MLQTLHRNGGLGKPVYGMKLGGVGFLMNHNRADDAGSGLLDRIAAAQPAVLRPLEMLAQTESGASVGSLAYNEVSLLRQTRQAAHLRIELNDQRRLEELICDGRSEEHTSELQSLMRISYAVFCLKNKKHIKYIN